MMHAKIFFEEPCLISAPSPNFGLESAQFLAAQVPTAALRSALRFSADAIADPSFAVLRCYRGDI